MFPEGQTQARQRCPRRQGGFVFPVQTPLMHCSPGEQRWSHWPQAVGSLFRSLQKVLQQAALPPGAVTQRLPHWPQLAGSLRQFMHAPSQQYWPLRQLFEQLPQN